MSNLLEKLTRLIFLVDLTRSVIFIVKRTANNRLNLTVSFLANYKQLKVKFKRFYIN